MENTLHKGRVTIPTDLDVVRNLSAFRALGLERNPRLRRHRLSRSAKKRGRKSIFHLLHHARKDNAWATANPDEVQQCYLMTGFATATESTLRINLMQGVSSELMQVNTRDDIKLVGSGGPLHRANCAVQRVGV